MSSRFNIALALLAVAGIFIPLLATSRYGAGLSPDSVMYIATARNMIRGDGFTNYDGEPTVTWPPLYPLLLASSGGFLGIDPLKLANWINALLFGALVLTAGILARRRFPASPGLALAAALATLASSALFGVAVMAWSEPLFIFLEVLSLLALDAYLVRPDRRSLLWLSAWVALTCLTRYIGVMLILWAAPWILLGVRYPIRRRLSHALTFGLISGLPLGIWALRNYAVSHTFFGSRASSAFTLAHNIKLSFRKMVEWYLPKAISGNRLLMILVGVGILILAGLSLWGLWGKKETWKAGLRLNGSIAWFCLVYASFLIASATISAYDLIDHRLLAPMYVPLILLLLSLVQAAGGPFRKRFSPRWVDTAVLVAVACWLVYPVRATYLDATHLYPRGEGYASKEWTQSETVQYLQQHPQFTSNCTLYTNDPVGAYIRADLIAQRSPAKTRYNSKEVVGTLADLKGAWPQETNGCLVWFNQINRSFLFTVGELKSIANLVLVAQLGDGAVYTVTR